MAKGIKLFLIALLLVPIPARAVDLPTSKDETEKSEIYRNEKYGFEVRYPKGFTMEEKFDRYDREEYTDFNPPIGVEGRISIIYNGLTDNPGAGTSRENPYSFLGISEEAFAFEPTPEQFLGKIRIDTVAGSHYVISNAEYGEEHQVFFENNGVRFRISARWGYPSWPPADAFRRDFSPDKKVIMEAFDKILSSFKFTKDRF